MGRRPTPNPTPKKGAKKKTPAKPPRKRPPRPPVAEPPPPPPPPEPWPEVFLATLAETANVSAAAQSAGINRSTAYERRQADPAFAAAWDHALDEAIDLLELEARRRAYRGTERPVFYQGDECGRVQEFSDTLMIFLLKAHRPEKYRENMRVELPPLEAVLAQLPHTIAQAVRGLLTDAVSGGDDSPGGGRPDPLPG